ncbi:MAG: hypothetical protein ACLPGW_03035 [Roseiarcus sp.]
MDRGGAEGSARGRMREAARKRRWERARLSADILDLNLENGNLKAVEPMLKVIGQLDKYHALSAAAPAPPPLALGLPPLAPAAPRLAEKGTEKGAQAVEIAASGTRIGVS